MNKVAIGIVGVIVVISVFLLLDSEEKIVTTTKIYKTTEVNEKESKVEEKIEDIKIEYTETKEFKEAKPEPKVVKEEPKKVEKYTYSEDVERVISEHALSSIQNLNNDKLTFKDKSGKYEAEIMVNSVNQRDPNMFPQIPILANVKLPSGEVINAQIDPTLAKSNDKIYIKVSDTQTGEDKIYNISDIANLGSGEKASVNLGSAGKGERGDVTTKSNENKLLPPMPPVN